MSITKHIAKQVRAIYFGGNWTSPCLKDSLKGLSWEQAKTQLYDFNTIATLTYHSTYYVEVLLRVLKEGVLDAKDEYSFQLPPINSQRDWEDLLDNAWRDAEATALLIEQMSDEKLLAYFTEKKYGNYYRNITGIIEHMHYHLGQIVLMRKMIERQKDASPA
jgi:hypothetical protein